MESVDLAVDVSVDINSAQLNVDFVSSLHLLEDGLAQADLLNVHRLEIQLVKN